MWNEIKAFGLWPSLLIIGLLIAAATWAIITIKRNHWAVMSVNEKIKWGIVWFMVVVIVTALFIYNWYE